jgi:ABC-type transport system involved in multi-copper enzyme maturation permease subunit
MKNFFDRLLLSYDYSTFGEFASSLTPSAKYLNITTTGGIISAIAVLINRLFGLDEFAFVALLTGFLVELGTGIAASIINKVQIESFKLSRFSIKAVCYLLLIALPYVFSVNFEAQGKSTATAVFDWMYLFFLCHIIWELIISILENLAVINGKSKEHWIKKLQDKLYDLFTGSSPNNEKY